MNQSVLIIGEDPNFIDFSAPGMPPDMSAKKVMDGLNGSRDRLEASGYAASILLTRNAETVEAEVSQKLRDDHYDVVVIGAGLRVLAPMAEQFEKLMNVLHRQAPGARLAFNTQPDDSDVAARRWLRHE
jgi:hypothetical protein